MPPRRVPENRTNQESNAPLMSHTHYEQQSNASSSSTRQPDQTDLPSNHVLPSRYSTRQIKTRSMTSNKTAPVVAFGGTVPQRDPRPITGKKLLPSNARNRIIDEKPNPRSTIMKNPQNPKTKAMQPIKSTQAVFDSDSHASVGRKINRRADDEIKENLPHTNPHHVPAPSHHRTRSCTASSSNSQLNSAPEDAPDSSFPSTRLTSDSNHAPDSLPPPQASFLPPDVPLCSSSSLEPPKCPPSLVNQDQPLQRPFVQTNRSISTHRQAVEPSLPSNKRLFAEIDESTNKNLFSFLDTKSKSNLKTSKLQTRPFFKGAQPLASQRAGPSNKPDQLSKVGRKLATSNKLQTTQPLKKKSRLNSPYSKLKVTNATPSTSQNASSSRISIDAKPEQSRLTPIPDEPQKSIFEEPKQSMPNGLKQSISDESQHCIPCKPQPPLATLKPSVPILYTFETSPLSTTIFNTSYVPPSIGRSLLPLPRIQNPPSSDSALASNSTSIFLSPLRPSKNSFPSQAKLPTNLESPLKRTFEGTSISPAPVIIKSKDQNGESEEETSADAIDFLSPKKRNKLTPLDIDSPTVCHLDKIEPSPISSLPKDYSDPEEARATPSVATTTLPPLPSFTSTTDTNSCPSSITAEQSRSPGNNVTNLDVELTHTEPESSASQQPKSDNKQSPIQTRPSTPTSDVESDATNNSPKRGIRTFQPIRISPIKEATMPTSIPISPSQITTEVPKSEPAKQNLNPFQTAPQPIKPSTTPLTGQIPTRPSMLPRRTLKFTQPASLSLDAIVENSPAKPLARDAMSSSSLNLSRGNNVPPKVIFTGGIKAKATEFYNRQYAFLKSSGNSSTLDPSSTSTSTEEVVEKAKEKNDGSNVQEVSSEAVEDEDVEDGCGDQSANSISTNQSMESSTSSSTNSSGNMSQETQERLTKLQAMLTRMNLPREKESESKTTDRATGEFTEYEVPLKDELDSARSRSNPGRRSVSVSLSSSNGPPNHTGNRLKSRASSSGLKQQLSSSTLNRRESNILPTSHIDLQSSRICGQGSTSTDNSNKTLSGMSSKRLVDDRNKKLLPLKDVVALVDVRTAEGDDAGKVFVEMLKGLGAKVHLRPTIPLTHIIFKAGKQTTIDKWLIHPKPKPSLVGIGWVVRCREILGKANETPYIIDINSTTAPMMNEAVNLSKSVGVSTSVGVSNRRKSMEPKALALLGHGLQLNQSQSRGIFNDPGKGKPENEDSEKSNQIAVSIERVRRKSLQFLPKVGSPLGKGVYVADGEAGEEEEEEENKK